MALTRITAKQVTYKNGSSGSVVRNLGESPVGKFYLDINIGWKAHDGFPRVMYAGRVISIRRTKGI